jgi:hypothetical protein
LPPHNSAYRFARNSSKNNGNAETINESLSEAGNAGTAGAERIHGKGERVHRLELIPADQGDYGSAMYSGFLGRFA